LGQLITGALFFAMQSCEYSATGRGDGPRKTKTLTCENIEFFKTIGECLTLIPHSAPLQKLEAAECIAIRFVAQKNDDKYVKVTQYCSGKQFCPVQAWAFTVKRVLNYPNAQSSDKVNTFRMDTTGKVVLLTAAQIRSHIKLAVASIGPKKLGVRLDRVGTHSLRTSCAMLLYLAKV
jgi:hypothetical protein